MARLGIAPRAPGTFRLPHVTRNHRTLERALALDVDLLIEPVHRAEQAAELGVVRGQSGQPFADWFAFPPGAVADRCKLVTIESRADIMRRRVRKWIAGEKRERAAIVVQKFPNEMQRPRIFRRRRHGGEPDLPIDPALVRCDDSGTPVRIARFGFEFVFQPFCIAGDERVLRSFENDFVAFAADGSKRTVSVYEIERIIGVIHQLPAGNEIEHRRDAQVGNQDRQGDRDGVVDARRFRLLRRLLGPPNEGFRQNAAKKCVIETGEKWNDRDIIQERQIAADDEDDLKTNEQYAGNMPGDARPERKPRHDQFDEMVPGCFDLMEPMRREMQVAADRIRDRLRFVMIIEAGEIAPAWVAAHFDEAGAEHYAKTEPAKKPDNEQRWPAFWERPPIEQRAEEDRQEAGFKKLNFPTVAVPDLADVDNRHVHRPKNREDDGVRVAG